MRSWISAKFIIKDLETILKRKTNMSYFTTFKTNKIREFWTCDKVILTKLLAAQGLAVFAIIKEKGRAFLHFVICSKIISKFQKFPLLLP